MEGDPNPRKHEGSGSGSEPAGQGGMSNGGGAAAGGLRCGGEHLDFTNQRGEGVAAGRRSQG